MLTAEQVERLREELLEGPNKVRRAREIAKLLQSDVCSSTGLSQPYYSAIERGDYGDLPLETSRTLADYFCCPIEVLFPPRDRAVTRDQPPLPFVRRKALVGR